MLVADIDDDVAEEEAFICCYAVLTACKSVGICMDSKHVAPSLAACRGRPARKLRSTFLEEEERAAARQLLRELLCLARLESLQEFGC